MLDFIQAGDASLIAFKNTDRRLEVIAKKQDILTEIEQYYNLATTSILFVGFNSFIFADLTKTIAITCASDSVLLYLKSQNIKFQHIPEAELINYRKQFNIVVAVDEFFTYAESDEAQRNLVTVLCNVATNCIITTLRDYKNQDYRDREFSQPAVVNNAGDKTIFLEYHNWDQQDRTSWTSNTYSIDQTKNKMITYGPFARRTMYFKQLAKFSIDAGATSFLVHKNLMYKGLTRKSYEHVISVKF